MGIDINELIPPDAVEEDNAAAQEFELWPEHADAVALLEACETQWQVLVGFGGIHYQGLPWHLVENAATRWLGIQTTKQLLWQMRVLVHEVKLVLNG